MSLFKGIHQDYSCGIFLESILDVNFPQKYSMLITEQIMTLKNGLGICLLGVHIFLKFFS